MLRHGVCFAWHGANKTISTCTRPPLWTPCRHVRLTENRAHLRQCSWRRAWSSGTQSDSNANETGSDADTRPQTPSASLTVETLGAPNQLLGAIHEIHPNAIPPELPPLPIASVPASSADVLDGLQAAKHPSLSLVPAQQQQHHDASSPSVTSRSIAEIPSAVTTLGGAAATAVASSSSTPAAPAGKQAPAKLLPEHQHWLQVVCVCASAAMLCYLTRTNVSTAIVPMAEQFAWDRAACGNILSAFFVGYGMTQVIGGQLADRYGGSAVLAGGLALWSACAVAAPAAATLGVAAVVATRVGVGLAQGLAFPAMHALLSRHVPPHRRSAAIGSIMGVAHCGTALAFGVSPYLIQTAGWQASFTAFSGAALLWLPFWLHMSRNLAAAKQRAWPKDKQQQQQRRDKMLPAGADSSSGRSLFPQAAGMAGTQAARSPIGLGPQLEQQHLANSLVAAAAAASERHVPLAAAAAARGSSQQYHTQYPEDAVNQHGSIRSNHGVGIDSSRSTGVVPAAPAAEVGFWPLMRRREVWAIAIAQYTSAWGFYGLLAWLPSFFLEHCGVPLNSIGAYTLAPYLVMALVGGSAGMLADGLIAKGWRVRDVRVVMQVAGMVGPATCLAAAACPMCASSPPLAAGFIAAAMGMSALTCSGMSASHLDIAPRHAGVVFGVGNTAGTLAGLVAVPAMGYVLQTLHSWPITFGIAAVHNIAGAAFWAKWAGDRPLPEDGPAEESLAVVEQVAWGEGEGWSGDEVKRELEGRLVEETSTDSILAQPVYVGA